MLNDSVQADSLPPIPVLDNLIQSAQVEILPTLAATADELSCDGEVAALLMSSSCAKGFFTARDAMNVMGETRDKTVRVLAKMVERGLVRASPSGGRGNKVFYEFLDVTAMAETMEKVDQVAALGQGSVFVWPDGTWCYPDEFLWMTHMGEDFVELKAGTPEWREFFNSDRAK